MMMIVMVMTVVMVVLVALIDVSDCSGDGGEGRMVVMMVIMTKVAVMGGCDISNSACIGGGGGYGSVIAGDFGFPSRNSKQV